MMRSRSRPVLAGLLVSTVGLSCTGGGAGERQAPRPEAGELAAEWRWEAPARASLGMPSADGDDVAFTYGHLRLAVYTAAGLPRWESERVGLRDVAPLFTPDLVLAATDDGVTAFDRSEGTEHWHADLGERANSPVVAAGRAVVSTWEGSLIALDDEGGRVAWRAPLPGPAVGPAAASADGTVVVTTWEAADGGAAGVVAVEAATGRRRWTVALEPGGVSAPAVTSGGVVVLVAGDVAAHGLELATGEARWRVETGGAGSPEVPPLALDDGAVLVAHRLGGMGLLDGRDGAVRWQAGADAAAVRGGPAGPGTGGGFALPLDDGRLLLAGPDRPAEILDPPGRVSGVAAGGQLLLVATRGAETNQLVALHGW
ncbi:MAG: PQQ-binding-like beta-propeller repeat protein [Actinomycetota bacterium]|nr:PQQ-binding-like beta-propeller repeat protein [Actinomycetota bacterium]